jgi:hypothetical protein
MRVGIACASLKKPTNRLRKKRFQKLFLDSQSHFGNHDLMIALQTTLPRRYRVVRLAQADQSCRTATTRGSLRRTAVGFDF